MFDLSVCFYSISSAFFMSSIFQLFSFFFYIVQQVGNDIKKMLDCVENGEKSYLSSMTIWVGF